MIGSIAVNATKEDRMWKKYACQLRVKYKDGDDNGRQDLSCNREFEGKAHALSTGSKFQQPEGNLEMAHSACSEKLLFIFSLLFVFCLIHIFVVSCQMYMGASGSVSTKVV